MKVFSIILGVILTIGGISLVGTPLMTFMSTGYYLAILLLVYGITGIIGAVVVKKFGANFVFSIISAIGGIAILSLPGFIAMTDMFLVYSMSVWFLIQGFVGISNAIVAKKSG